MPRSCPSTYVPGQQEPPPGGPGKEVELLDTELLGSAWLGSEFLQTVVINIITVQENQ